jgi:hypothetical protein
MILGLRLCGGGGTMNFAFGLAPMLGLLLAEINERRKRHAPVIFRHSVWRGIRIPILNFRHSDHSGPLLAELP